MIGKRNRTSPLYIKSNLCLYFLGLSTRYVARAMFFLYEVKRGHVAIWNWIQKHHPQKILSRRRGISEFIIGEDIDQGRFGINLALDRN